jgi:membrane protease YdiL (CAAX protease family)
LLLPVVFLLVTGIVLGLRAIAPWTHTVAESPLEQYMRNPLDTAIFAVVAVLAGGVREELQRAFILHRFEQRLGGAIVGLAVFSVTFGALHVNQGVDVATAVGVLGLIWGILYLKRRSAVMAMVNHGSFNAAQVLQVVLARLLGA